MMSMAEMAAFDNLEKLTGMAEGLATFVRQAVVGGAAAHEVEKGVWQRVLAMGREATGQFFQMQGDGDVGETIKMSDGDELRRLPEPHRRTYRSIFGPFTLTRYVYGTREGQRISFVPLDARLGLPESELSYVLQDWAGTLCVEHAFARTAQTLDTILGFSLSVDSLERMSRTMAESVAGFRDTLEKPPVEEEGEILVATADGKGIPMRRPAEQRPVGGASQERREGEQETDGHAWLRLHSRRKTSQRGRRACGSFSRKCRMPVERIFRACGTAQAGLVEFDVRRG